MTTAHPTSPALACVRMMRTPAPFLLALTCACAGAAPADVSPPSPNDRCGDDEAFRDCAYRTEAPALARVAGRAWRNGDTLVVAIADGTVALVSDTTAGDAYIVYRYEERLGRERQHVVAYHFYEGGGFAMVDERTGLQVDLAGRPVVSPRGARFAVASADLWAMYDPNAIQVWRFTGGLPVMEWGLDGGETWGAADPVWRSETILDFVRVERADDGLSERRTPMRVRMDGGRFRVEPIDERTR